MKVKKYPFVTCSKEVEDNIIYVEYAENLIVNMAIAKELVASRLDFAENQKHYVIIDVSNVKQVTSEAKKYLQSKEAGLKDILAGAFIASNNISALFANIFAKTPGITSTFVASKKDALIWINEVKKKQVTEFK
ncbi:MAG TPA: hypothetical protein VN698_01380 [Bacteroidia bacterium]|nr:hypothetical protein [Bacteroidia bacterium]